MHGAGGRTRCTRWPPLGLGLALILKHKQIARVTAIMQHRLTELWSVVIQVHDGAYSLNLTAEVTISTRKSDDHLNRL